MKFLLVVYLFTTPENKVPVHVVHMPSWEMCILVKKNYERIAQEDVVLKKYPTRVDCFNPNTVEVAD